MKESTWILYSFDVKMDGKNACRLTDKKFQNHENTVDLAGTIQDPKTCRTGTMLCEIWKECDDAVNKANNLTQPDQRRLLDQNGRAGTAEGTPCAQNGQGKA